MTIKSKLIILALLPVVLAVVAVAAVLWMNQESLKSKAFDRSTYEITKNIFDLRLSMYQYIRQPEERPKTQFQSAHDSLKGRLAFFRSWNEEEESTVKSIGQNHQVMGELFSALVSLQEKNRAGLQDQDTPELRERIVGQLLANASDMATDALRLSRMSSVRLDSIHYRGIYSMLLFIFCSTLGALVFSYLAVKSITNPVRKLREGAEAVASGDWHYQVEVETRDEMGELTKAFNSMTGKLRESYVSIKDLQQEIAERKRAEEALRHSEERFRQLSAATFEGIGISEGGMVVDGNPQLAAMLGWDLAELIGRPVLDFVAPESVALVMDHMRSGSEERYEHFLRRKDGSIFPAEAHGRAMPWKDSTVRVTALRDITERKQAEEALRRSRDELELRVQERTVELRKQAELIELSHDAILVRDMESRIIFWSKGAEEMYGWRKEEVLGKDTHTLLQTRFPIPLPEVVTELMEKGHWDGELVHIRREGQKITVLSRWVLQWDEARKPIAIFEINIDITERKKMEEQLRQMHKMEALGTLAGGIAHDFNNLLMPILINTEMALMDIKNGVLPSAESMEMVMAGANRGKELVEQIITFSRHRGESLKPVDIAPITKETIKFLRATVPATVRFQTLIEAPSPLVLANPGQIHQILMNLVNNAAHSMQEQGGILEISLAKVEKDETDGMNPGRYVCLTVKDTGCGMTPEVKEKAFDPFFTTKGPGNGTGMGLAVVHGIVKKHGGEIRLESELGKGTTVNVFLPVFEGMKKEEPTSPVLGIPTGSERILFIDDEEVQTRSVEAMLKRLGYRAITETDPRKALEIFRAQPDVFDLVITDQVMPYLPGNRLSQELLTIRPDIPIILCTGFSETVDEEKVGAFGIREFIQKPFTMIEISQAIRKVLGPKGDA